MRRTLLTCLWISLSAVLAPSALAQEPPAAAGTIEVTGRVLTQQGEPALGATVQFTRFYMDRYGPGEDTQVDDAQGRFSCRIPLTGLVEVVAYHKDFGAARTEIDSAPKGPLELTLDPRYWATIQVFGAGEPPSFETETFIDEVWSKPHTPQQGFPHFRQGDIVVAVRDGSRWASGRLQVGQEPFPTLTLQLRPGRALNGRILGLSPRHLAQLRVESLSQAWMRVLQAKVWPDGSFRFESLPPGPAGITVSVSGTAFQWRESVDIPAQGVVPWIEVGFSQRPALELTILAGGNPASKSRAQVVGPRDRAYTQSTDEQGRLRLEGLDAGTYRLLLNISGVEVERRLEVPAHLERTIDIPASDLKGRVLDFRGAPVAEALVALQGPVQTPFPRHPIVRTQADGSFSFPALPQESLLRLTAWKDRMAVAHVILQPQERRPVEIRLQPSPTAVLEVRDWAEWIPEELHFHLLSEDGTLLSYWKQKPSVGVFLVEGLSPRGSRLAIMSIDSVPLHLEARAGQSLSLRLQRGAVINLKTPWLADGGASFTMRGPQGQVPWIYLPTAPQFKPGGWITFGDALTPHMSNLAPGRWTVMARWPDGTETASYALADPQVPVWLDISQEKPQAK